MGTSASPSRIGVYVCHCGLNIAGTLDCEALAKYASTLSNVKVARDYRYMCADPGQAMIKKDIKELGLNRVIVAACSPRMHEPTFRRCVAEAGLNPYLFEMANIREHCSWCHPHAGDLASEKARDLIASAVAKARLLAPLEEIEVGVERSALVIGGGVSGIQAALDLSDMGFNVYLVEREPSIGGRMAQLDKTFPTLDCSICILGPLMVDISRRRNVKLFVHSEVERVDGYIGNFRVRVTRRAQYVDPTKCNACGECAKVCPVEVPNEFEAGLGWRKAIDTPFPQAVPPAYVLDDRNCLGLVPLACSKCKEACDKSGAQAINYDQRPDIVEFRVGTIIVATGYDLLDASKVKEYGYGPYPNVMTCLELERMVNAAGPTGGKVIRPSDGKNPRRVAFIQCVGSRDERWSAYCSGFCCMYTIKNAILLKDHYPDTEITIFYIDMRTSFKGYEEFYRRARELGISFIRGKPAEVSEEPATGNLVLYSENQMTGKAMSLEADLVVLSQSAVPPVGMDKLARILNVTTDGSGFLLEAHPKLKPIDTSTSGIFICGSAQGPKDIPFSVAQGSAAASRAARILSRDRWFIEPIVSLVSRELCIRGRESKSACQICVTRCPFQAIGVEPGQPAMVNPAKCQGCGTCVAECPHNAITQMHFTDEQIVSQIRELLRNEPEKKILAFLCNWCSYAGADLAGTSRFEYPANVRTVRVMCSGRVDRDFVMAGFMMGAGMVLVSGCRLTDMGSDCHYISGNVWAKKRVETLRRVIEGTGISRERLRLEWISAAEGQKFADLVRDMDQKLKALGPEKIREENARAKPNLERMLRHTPMQEQVAQT